MLFLNTNFLQEHVFQQQMFLHNLKLHFAEIVFELFSWTNSLFLLLLLLLVLLLLFFDAKQQQFLDNLKRWEPENIGYTTNSSKHATNNKFCWLPKTVWAENWAGEKRNKQQKKNKKNK